jgi:DNA-directed RNA polymerase subunit N (RpoN/RPB10)
MKKVVEIRLLRVTLGPKRSCCTIFLIGHVHYIFKLNVL